MSNEGKTKMSMGQRLAYSFGAFGNDAFYGLLSGYLIMFITSHLFNSGNQAVDNKMISLVTLIIMALRIVELFIDPFIGNAIDRTKTRWGHFRPWVVAGGTVSAVSVYVAWQFVSEKCNALSGHLCRNVHHDGHLLFIQGCRFLVNAPVAYD